MQKETIIDQGISSIIPKTKNDYGKKECVRITRLLASFSVNAAIIKGPFLNEICQTDKVSHNLDILVAEKDLQIAWDILKQHYDPHRDSQLYIDYNKEHQNAKHTHIVSL